MKLFPRLISGSGLLQQHEHIDSHVHTHPDPCGAAAGSGAKPQVHGAVLHNGQPLHDSGFRDNPVLHLQRDRSSAGREVDRAGKTVAYLSCHCALRHRGHRCRKSHNLYASTLMQFYLFVEKFLTVNSTF